MEMNKVQELLDYINETPRLMSLLYDINLLPEQTSNTSSWELTLLISAHWKDNDEAKKE